MAEKDLTNIEQLMTDVVLESPAWFTMTDGKETFYYYVYPPSLGISLLAGRLRKKLDINKNLYVFNKEYEMLRLCKEHRETVLRLVAIHTFKRRSDANEEKKVQERMKELEPLDTAELSGIFQVIMSWENQTELFLEQLGLNKERRERERISRFKDEEGSSMTYGGKSVYGIMLDHAAERYGWELGYILWGISLTNLNMMLQDSVQSVYLSTEERKKLHIRAKGKVIKADDPSNNDIVAAFISGS